MVQTALETSVIICAYTEDRWNELIAAIESVQSQSVRVHETIVVVDHNPALLAKVRTRFPGVIAVENREPRGLSGARNSGIAAAQGEILAFLDDDAIAAPDWLERLCAAYSDPDVIGVGGAIEPLWQDGRPAWFPSEFDWVVGCTYRGMPQTIAPVRNLIGCNMSLRRKVFDMVGGFRIGRVGALSVGREDDETELCIRARKQWKGGVLLCNPWARVLHHVPLNRAHWTYYRSRCYSEGWSKAIMAKLVGYRDGLASERSYTLHVLPLGVVQGLTDVLRGDLAGLGRAAAIAAGLAITTIGYIMGLTVNRFQPMASSGQNEE
jgi:GT2 family glycosyltransferase